MTIPIERESLDSWARFVNRVRVDVHQIRLQITRGEGERAKESLESLRLESARTLTSMREAGAASPHGTPEASPVPISLLHTEATVRLVSALEEAYEAAQAVDRERYAGKVEEGEDVHAAPIGEILDRWRLEVYGPVGKE